MDPSSMQEAVARFRRALPSVVAWIDNYIATTGADARPVSEAGFQRLPQFFPPTRLASSKVVVVGRVAAPPLGSFGLTGFRDFESMPMAGVTYKDTFFVTQNGRSNESIHFHELVHVVQWDELGPDAFLLLYGVGLAQHGYRASPLEAMAYRLQAAFDRGEALPGLESTIRKETRQLWLAAAGPLGLPAGKTAK